MKREAPKINTQLRSHTIMVPECIRNASGIVINGKRIKSLLFSTDVAVISNCNADAVIAVYPFTPTMQITNSIIDVAQRPVFAGVGGGTTAGPRVREIALDAELHGATAVVLNAPTKTEFIQELSDYVDIPVVLSIVSLDENLEERMLHSGATIVNVSGGKNTVAIVKALRERFLKIFQSLLPVDLILKQFRQLLKQVQMPLHIHRLQMVKFLKR